MISRKNVFQCASTSLYNLSSVTTDQLGAHDRCPILLGKILADCPKLRRELKLQEESVMFNSSMFSFRLPAPGV